jgi:hypothetical protein
MNGSETRKSLTRVVCGLTLALLGLVACTREILPTSAVPEEPPAAPNAAPTPVIIPTPTPVPTATPEATSCPTLLGIKITVFVTQPERDRVILDATPLSDQCDAFTGRLVCPLGPAGTTRREHCEVVRIGEGGPAWRIEPYGDGRVNALPGSGYLAEVFGKGRVTACSRIQPDICTNFEVR